MKTENEPIQAEAGSLKSVIGDGSFADRWDLARQQPRMLKSEYKLIQCKMKIP